MIGLKKFIRRDFNEEQDKNRKFNKIRRSFDLTIKGDYTIDDTTWNDLEMDSVFSKVDRTYSTPGEDVLYSILRNPVMKEDILKERERIIDVFAKDLDLTTKMRCIIFKLGVDSKNTLLEMLNGLLTINKKKYYIYTFLGKILPLGSIVCSAVFREGNFMFCFMISLLINVGINRFEDATIEGSGLGYLRDLISTGKKLSRIDNKEVEGYTNNIKETLREIKNIDRETLIMAMMNGFGGLFGLLLVPFLIEETSYYKISGEIDNKKGQIYKLLYQVGEIDALIGIASYRLSYRDIISTPEFTEDKKIIIECGVNPLLKNPVGNTISIDKRGIVLTGTNMSGKSTFLRMVGVNIILAQTFNFVFAKEYKSCFLNIVSSISPKDDISSGKSYYLAEAESLLRVIKALEKDVTVFTLIDEIFRGTNPIERIASSSQILKYINKRQAMVIVATHDRELTDMLSEEYDFYYFSEDVDEFKGLKFDYKIKKGVSKTRNAIKLLEYIGYPKEIIIDSYNKCKEIEKYF